MVNSPICVFDNIGCSFAIKNNKFLIGQSLNGYKTLNSDHINAHIPYIARQINGSNIAWEIGIGKIIGQNQDIFVERVKIIQSSSNDNAVNFGTDGEKTFFVFANEYNFNTGLNNVIIKNDNFIAYNVNAVYVVDITGKNIEATLPSATENQGLEIRFKTVGDIDNSEALNIKDSNGDIISFLSGANRYINLISTGESWIELKDSTKNSVSSQAFSIQSGSALNVVLSGDLGNDRALSYNDNGELSGSSVYYSTNDELLFGSALSSSAHHIIPVDGSGNVVFNNDSMPGNFLVNGSGNRNLLFTYDGRLGLNMPSGVRPQTLFHLINYSCQEGMRFENRSSCHPANVTLYHKPSTNISPNTVVGTVTLAGKDSNGNKVDYGTIQTKAISSTAGQTQGQLELVVNNGTSGISPISVSPTQSYVGYNNKLVTNSTGPSVLGTNTNKITVSNDSINLQSNAITIGTTNGNVTIPQLTVSNSIAFSYVAPNTLLTVDDSGILTGNGSLHIPSVPSGKILSTDAGGEIVGYYNTSDFFLTTQDITWNKYPKQLGNICLRQIALTSPAPIEEFVVGDQIAIITPSKTFYRTITSLDIENNTITGMLINQTISLTEDTTNIETYSVTRGGYLLMQMYVEPGSVADATSNILSIRPLTDTVFNTEHKDINFVVYGTDPVPALAIKSNSGRSLQNYGTYYSYSTMDNREPFAIQINSSGNGINNTNNTANFQYTASGRFSGMVSTVGTNGQPSFYGTYDQNGNVAEWVEDSHKNSTSVTQYAAGGSWASMVGEALHSIAPSNYSGCYQDIGFRICSMDGLVDDFIDTGLHLDFVNVNNPGNIADSHTISVVQNDVISQSGITNLGLVNHLYRIGKYEITNAQYVRFLNAVATTDSYGLYNTQMTNSPYGGILRSGTQGSYAYATKNGMVNKPVNFVNYLSAIRFTNWLHNGAPTGEPATNNTVVEDGAYEILSLGNNSYQINKNTYQNYWLPSIHEWYKSAYFQPSSLVSTSGTSSVVIKRNDPFVISSGSSAIEYANLSVSGWLYADKLILGDGSFSSEGGPEGTGIKYVRTSGNSIHFLNDTMILESGSYKLTLGNQNNITLSTGKSLWDKTYGNYLSSNRGIELSTSGNISLISSSGDVNIYATGYVNFSGIKADSILCKNFKKIGDDGTEDPIYPGASGALVYKKDDFNPGTSDQFIFDSDNKLNFPDGQRNSPIYVADTGNGMVVTYTGVHYLSDSVEIDNPVILPQIQIGSDKPFFKGSVLTHAGEGYATWEPAEYLKADGMLWNRYLKRPILIYQNRFVFDDKVTNGDVTEEQASIEFSYSDTIALVNLETRETTYVKAADDNLHIIDNNGDPISVNSGVVTTDSYGLGVSFCPSSPWSLSSGCAPVSGYAYAVNKGGYLTMQLDPLAVSGFSCDAGIVDNNSALYSFKPSTLNTISIRPNISTAFNLLAEDIDFAVYGASYTSQYHRYDPAIYGLDEHGLPSGLTPAFKIDAIHYNAVSGNPQSGVLFSGYLDVQSTIPTGYHPDRTGKICVNTKQPYTIATIPSGTGTLNVISDLTVNGYTYSSGIIANEFYVRPIPSLDGSSKFIANAPLTINSYGQIVSQTPESAPTVPGSPTSVAGETGNGCVSLSWIAPTNNGRSDITNYNIEYSSNSGSTWVLFDRPSSVQLSETVTGLTNGVTYIFRVSAVNAVGTGEPSIVSGGLTPTTNKPSIPRNLVTVKNNLSRTLSWDAPALTGSSSIVSYTIEYSIDYGATWLVASSSISSSTRSYTITGLSNGPTYYVRIKATNSSGSGAYAQAVSIGDDPWTDHTTTNNSQIWDFGIVSFTGVCS